ncbi:MAG TPA: DUF2569 domain-containing protein [Sphingomicrobium sp.]|nr:DUF2569 domain-containing protein [Sphingomicrobium sp.]
MRLVSFGRRVCNRLNANAAAIHLHLENRLDQIVFIWLFLASLACSARVAFSPLKGPFEIATILPYVLLVCAPAASLLLALRWFRDGDYKSQPQLRLAVFGNWRTVDRSAARLHSLYGARGLLVSLMVGVLINVPVRALEYLGSMPALSGSLPKWLSVLHTMMTLDVVVMTSLYSIAFVAALRCVPLFPRLLAAIWGIDLALQLATAKLVAGTAILPPPVSGALQDLLDGNVKKVLISMALWLPYLLLSKRVNVTYRSRIPV